MEEKRKRGRPKGSGKCTHETIELVCAHIARGLTVKGACSEAGIGTTTYYVWKQRADKAKVGIYREFRDAVEAAQAKAKNLLEHKAMTLAMGYKSVTVKEHYDNKTGEIIELKETKTVVDSQTLRFILERRWPDEYGRKDKVDVTNDGKPFEVPLFGAVMGQGDKKEDESS